MGTNTNQYEHKRRPSNSGLQSSSKMSNMADRQNKLREQRNKYRNSDQDEDEDEYDNIKIFKDQAGTGQIERRKK